jgi:hypothetical protein
VGEMVPDRLVDFAPGFDLFLEGPHVVGGQSPINAELSRATDCEMAKPVGSW